MKFLPLSSFFTSIIIVCLYVSGCSGEYKGSEPLPHEALEHLNNAIANSADYHRQKERQLDSIKNRISDLNLPHERWLAYVKLSESYRQTDADSAIVYAAKALDLTPLLPDSVTSLPGELAFIDALSTAGIFPPALHKLDSLSQILSTPAEKISYWQTARRCYSYIMTWVENHDYYFDTYRKKYRTCDDSLLRFLPHTDRFYHFIRCERLVDEHKWGDARNQLEILIRSLPQESNLYAMAAYQLAIVYKNRGDFKEYARYLSMAAESDIKSCVREGLALPTLANWVYEHGDLDNAFRYVNYILEDANSSDIRMRTPAIAPIIPLIDSAIQRRALSSRRNMLIYIIVTTVLFIATIILLIYTVHSLKRHRINQEKLAQSSKKLAQSSKKLEAYIGNFIGLCSNYAARLNQLSKLVTRKIAAGQSDDLVKLINSGKFAEEDNEEFYRLIDKALLDIYPDFVKQINSLLLPDSQIIINTDEPLTPELRIYAFVRLGVDQSNRIAQILGYSVNTVYAYRNRMRNRAADRENFDTLVASLG